MDRFYWYSIWLKREDDLKDYYIQDFKNETLKNNNGEIIILTYAEAEMLLECFVSGFDYIKICAHWKGEDWRKKLIKVEVN